jgi:branched-chain amino acid transport system ATP-binding protein
VNVLEVTGLEAGYGKETIVDGVSLRARRGEITVIVGPNGSGKSTLMKAITGVVRVFAGKVELNGRDITGMASTKLARAGVSYVPQVDNVFPSLTVLENLEMGGYVRKDGLEARIEELYAVFPDLREAARRPARTLSGGQRNMLAMARALMIEPELLCIDEPTAGLSPVAGKRLWDQVLRVRDLGVAVLVIEQNTRQALAHADYSYVLAMGELRFEDTGAELLASEKLIELYVGAVRTGEEAAPRA